MLIEQAVVLIEKILDDKPELNHWELNFVATISRIAASGKIEQLTKNQSLSLIKIYSRNVMMPKLNSMVDESEFKCQSCNHGCIEDKTGSTSCPHCDGNGYIK
jgi:rubrerythrin